jgi:transglutaminase-like putative cysteine protease
LLALVIFGLGILIPLDPRGNLLDSINQDLKAVTGFSEAVRLDFVGTLKDNDARAVIARFSTDGRLWTEEEYSSSRGFPILMRGGVAAHFDRGILSDLDPETQERSRPAFLDSEERYLKVEQEIFVAANGTRRLFSLGYPVGTTDNVFRSEGFVRAPRPPHEKFRYGVSSRVLLQRGRHLLREERIEHSDDRLRIRIPMSAEASTFSRSLWKELRAETSYDRVLALESWFQFGGGFRYTRKSENNPEDPVTDFLMNTRAGYCAYFAVAMVGVLREWGIPSRVALGYRGGTYSKLNTAMVFLQRDAHAWVEVPFNQTGWVSFDPTPPDTRLDAIDDRVSLGDNGVGEDGNGNPTAKQEETDARSSGPWRFLWIALSLLLSTPLIYFMQRKRSAFGNAQKLIQDVRSLDVWFIQQGVRRLPTQTFREIRDKLPGLKPSVQQSVNHIIGLLELLRFSGKPISSDKRQELRARIRDLPKRGQST